MDAPLNGFPSVRTGFDRSLWLTTLRPLEDVDAAPRDRLEAYFELLDFICDARPGTSRPPHCRAGPIPMPPLRARWTC
ncbi:hypothetical protein [Pigmentiphaga litoralis]|uniref:hypothetical protein n=1 Tax=Pigmentiphaga litoralis TaxID=516702 RepID=UPI003B42F604